MSIDDGGMSRDEHNEIRDLVLASTQRIRPAGSRRRQVVGAGVVLLLIGVIAGGVLTWIDRHSPDVVSATPDRRSPDAPATATSTPSRTPTPTRAPIPKVVNGWVAFAAEPPGGESDIYLGREGRPALRVIGSDDDRASQACPAFSPDGKRLVAGQATGTDDSGWRDAGLVITDLTVNGKPSRTETIPLDGIAEQPCAIWSADGRWLALLAGTPDPVRGLLPRYGEVWVIELETNDIRRITGLGATDIEWAPHTDELFIASNGVQIYSTATGKTRPVANTSEVVAFAVSPDGESLAAELDSNGDDDGPSQLALMAADGSDRRVLVADYDVNHGIGPVWSPDGHRVAFQRLCETFVDGSGKRRQCYEEHEIGVVAVSDQGSVPFGTVSVIAPPRTTEDGVTSVWAPFCVSWSPDSRALLFVAWSADTSGDSGCAGEQC